MGSFQNLNCRNQFWKGSAYGRLMSPHQDEPSRHSRLALSALMVAAGVAHFLVPEPYERIVPGFLGRARLVVCASGVAEVVAGALLATPRTRRAGAWLSLGILVGVFPANVKMALDGGIEGYGFPIGSPVVAWLRLPLQIPLIVWAWRHARNKPPGD